MAPDPTAQNVSDRQAQFCREYLRTNNAAGAYQVIYGCTIKAAESGGSRLLRNAKVQAYLAQLRQTTARRSEVTLERTLEEIAAVAFASITQVLTFTDDGVRLHDSESLPPEVTAAIESISINETITDGGRTVKKSVKLHNKLTALGFLVSYFGIDNDFNQARATLKRYGLALVEDPSNPSGWSIKPYET